MNQGDAKKIEHLIIEPKNAWIGNCSASSVGSTPEPSGAVVWVLSRKTPFGINFIPVSSKLKGSLQVQSK